MIEYVDIPNAHRLDGMHSLSDKLHPKFNSLHFLMSSRPAVRI